MTKANFDLQLEIVMIQNSFIKISLQVIEFLLILLTFPHTKQW